MLNKILKRISEISVRSKIILLIGVGSAMLLMLAAVSMPLLCGESIDLKYLRMQMAETAVTLFSVGVVLGLFSDYLFLLLKK